MTTVLEIAAWIVAIVLACVMALVARGFLPVALRADGSPVYHLSAGVVLVLFASALRAIYWDVMPMVLNGIEPGLWSAWHGMAGRPVPNMLMGLIFIAGARHLLVLFWMMIPDEARGRYSILTAPFYPRVAPVLGSIAALVRALSRRRG